MCLVVDLQQFFNLFIDVHFLSSSVQNVGALQNLAAACLQCSCAVEIALDGDFSFLLTNLIEISPEVTGLWLKTSSKC